MSIIETVQRFIQKALRPFRSFRIYAIYCCEDVISSYEDPHCPWEWRGSGCYDIDVYTLNARVILVTARDKSEAVAVREKYMEEEIQSAKSFKEKNPDKKGPWWISDVEERIGYHMDIRKITATDIPLYAWDEHKEVIDEIVNEHLCESEQCNVIKAFTDDNIVDSFKYKLKSWETEHDRREIKRLSELIQKENSYLLRLLYTYRKEKCERTTNCKSPVVAILRQV